MDIESNCRSNAEHGQHRCPISGAVGNVNRAISGDALFRLYQTYMGKRLPEEFFSQYFRHTFVELYSSESGLRWYQPNTLGDGKYYEALASAFPWYYNPGSWDKQLVVETVLKWPNSTVVEIGSGDGWLLSKLRSIGISAIGIEINENAIQSCRERGLTVFRPGESIGPVSQDPILCLVQTIEHVSNPLDFMRSHIRAYSPKHVIVSAPCFESLLGFTSDPLCWPPHHATSWSAKAFGLMAQTLGYDVNTIRYSPLTYDEFISRVQREQTGRIKGIPRIWCRRLRGRIGRLQFNLFQTLGKSWACRSHSIFVVMSRNADP